LEQREVREAVEVAMLAAHASDARSQMDALDAEAPLLSNHLPLVGVDSDVKWPLVRPAEVRVEVRQVGKVACALPEAHGGA